MQPGGGKKGSPKDEVKLPHLTKQKGALKGRESKKKKSKSEAITSSMKGLNAQQRRAFRKIFDSFDIKKSSTITAEELLVCVNSLAGYDALSLTDVMTILEDLDVKGTGDIEFDEFIYFMTRPQNLKKMLTDEDRKLIEEETGIKQEEAHEDNNKKELLFHIIRKVLEQDENRDIRTYYRAEIISKINDHVIDDWSDGKRCVGLSNATMLNRYKNILRRKYRSDSVTEKDSPYAKPNMWGVNELKRDLAKQKCLAKTNTKSEMVLKKAKRVKVREMQVTVKAVPLPIYHVKQGQRTKFTYEDLKQIRVNVSKLKKDYYGYLRETSNENQKLFHEEAGINKIKNAHNRKMTNLAFESYCNPFVIAPWVPMVNPTGWKYPPKKDTCFGRRN